MNSKFILPLILVGIGIFIVSQKGESKAEQTQPNNVSNPENGVFPVIPASGMQFKALDFVIYEGKRRMVMATDFQAQKYKLKSTRFAGQPDWVDASLVTAA